MKVKQVGQFIPEKFFVRSSYSLWVSPLTGWLWTCMFHLRPLMTLLERSVGLLLEMAARLAKYFRTSEQFWLNLQDAFAIHQVKQKHSKELKAIRPLAAAPRDRLFGIRKMPI
jgi:hypothetical protein